MEKDGVEGGGEGEALRACGAPLASFEGSCKLHGTESP